jgi:signal transduction histidine kinase
MSVLTDLLDSDALTPHGFCLSWDPALMALHVISDGLIGVSYYSIPLAIMFLLLRRRDATFGWVGWLFATFILACGTTHFLGIWTLWHPDYFIDGAIKAVTAVASLLTAIVLWPLIPRIAALPSLAGLLAANEQLMEQIRERDQAVEALQLETVDRMKAEAMLRQSQKMEAIGQLTGGVAHDFNNLLQVVQANLEVLSMRLDTEDPRRRYLDRAIAGAGRGAVVTRQLLAFSRQQSLRPCAFDAAERVRGMTELLRSTLGGRITLELPHDDEQWAVDADPNQFETAILNLAINARDAMPNGGRLQIEAGAISVRSAKLAAASGLQPGEYIAISVADTGVGMTGDVRSAAFEPFFTTKTIGQGSGLGLSQVYGFARQSQGHVTIDSTLHHGTTVTIYLRRAADLGHASYGLIADGVGPSGVGGLASNTPDGADYG